MCKFWLRIIQSSVELEYQVELGVHRKIDGAYVSAVSIHDRLQTLRKHTAAWRDLSWARRDEVALDNVLPGLGAMRTRGYHRLLRGLERVSLYGFPSTLARDLSTTYIRGGLSLNNDNISILGEQGLMILEWPDDL